MPALRFTLRRAALVATAFIPVMPSLIYAQQSASIDWNRLREETVEVLADYIRINTTNPPGNELQTALYLKRILDREGIPAEILDTAELKPAGRANLYARLKGNGTKKAIALVHHMDVVPSDPRYWSVDPFSGRIKDGYVWGRGALDMKGEGIIHLMAMIALKRSGVPLNRDIVFIANSDEELDGLGAETFVNRHADVLKDVEYLITEGGDNKFENGKLAYYGVGIAEKRTFWQHVTVHGTPSHGSRPTSKNPVPRLVAALDRIAKYETPLHVTPGVDKYFRDISRSYSGEQKQWLSNVRVALNDPAARSWILSDVYWNAILRNTISLTGLKGSNKTNVIPAEASADLDVRLLPDADPDEFLATLQGVVADTAVHFEPELAPKPALESPIETEFFHAIERAAHDRDPNAFVTTPMLTGATDRPTYRKLGIVTYGFDPFKVETTDAQRGVHGNDERLSVENVGFGVHYLYDVLRYAQGTRVTP
ncbi:MAG TPA: M20/M25/M40 family metallo-hydrolase [Gemmatimonadaceae bacterium]|jgi:acetylornithine deacetylase/succinyl-diaminopimelate desuccinylase-like protein